MTTDRRCIILLSGRDCRADVIISWSGPRGRCEMVLQWTLQQYGSHLMLSGVQVNTKGILGDTV